MKSFSSIILFLCFASISFCLLQQGVVRMPIRYQTEAEAFASNKRVLLQKKKLSGLEHVYQKDKNMVCDVGFGDGKYKATMSLQSTKSDTWIPTTGCDKCMPKGSKKAVYECKKPCKKDANAAKVTDKTSMVNFEKKITVKKGEKATDTLLLHRVSAKDVPIILATQLENRNEINTDGVLGLGYSSDNIVAKLKKDNKIAKAIFSYYISDTQSFLTFGDYMLYLSQENFKTYDFKPSRGESARWQLDLVKVQYQNRDMAAGTELSQSGAKLIFDVSIEGYRLPKKDLAHFKTKIKQTLQSGTTSEPCKHEKIIPKGATEEEKKAIKAVYWCKCSSLSKLPTFQLSFKKDDKTKWSLKPEAYAYYKDKKCITRLEEGDSRAENKDWVVGRQFLRNFYVVFDQQDSNALKIMISDANKVTPSTMKLPVGIQGTVIGVGIAIALVAVIILLVVLKPIADKEEPAERKQPTHHRELPVRQEYQPQYQPQQQYQHQHYATSSYQPGGVGAGISTSGHQYASSSYQPQQYRQQY